jgi:hypothetical protein
MVDVYMMIAHSWWGESHPGRSVDRARELVDRSDAVARYHRLRG